MSVIGPVQSRYHEGITIYWQKIYVFPPFLLTPVSFEAFARGVHCDLA